MIIIESLKNKIIYLQNQQQTNYSNIAVEDVKDFSVALKEYKKNIGKDILFFESKKEIKKLRNAKLHFRVVDSIKELDKQHQRLPLLFSQLLPREFIEQPRNARLRAKTYYRELEEWLIKNIDPTSLAVKLAQEFKWGHGTSSAALALIKHSDFTLLSSGEMLQLGRAPMGGELRSGGMFVEGVNQTKISAVSIEDIGRAWNQYATNLSFKFSAEKYEDFEPAFLCGLESLMSLSPDDHTWDEAIIFLLRAKQWNPEEFTALCSKHCQKIEELKEKIIQRCSYREHNILKALDWDLQELRLAIGDEEQIRSIETRLGIQNDTKCVRPGQNWFDDTRGIISLCTACGAQFMNRIDDNWQTLITIILKARLHGKIQGPNEFEQQLNIRMHKEAEQTIRKKMEARIHKNMIPFKKRYQRLLNLFDSPPQMLLSEQDRSMIVSPFPVLFVSTRTKATAHPSGKEIVIERAQLGKDIDLVFVKPENLLEMQNWLKQFNLEDKVKAYSSEYVEQMAALPIQHSPDQIIDYLPYLTIEEQKLVSETLEQKVLPLYQAAYPDGKRRIHHGPMHALRAALIAQVLAEFYRKGGYALLTKLVNLINATGLHDGKRKNDGPDQWDDESGNQCEEILLELGVEPGIASLFNEAIADKESLHPNSLEHKILHDADCLEILRFMKNLDAFIFDKLWIYKELPQDTVIELIKEVCKFISLTEEESIKAYIENNDHPYCAILQVMSFAYDISGRFSQMTECLASALAAFAQTQDLTLPIQQKIRENLSLNQAIM